MEIVYSQDFVKSAKIYTKKMTIEKSGNENLDIKNIEKTIRQDGKIFLQPRIHELLQRAEAENKQDKKHFVMDSIALYEKTFFQGKKHLFNDVIKNIDATHYDNDADLEKDIIEQLINAIFEFAISSGFSLKELRQYFNDATSRQSDFIPLDKNNVLSYSRFNDIIEVHITKGFTMQIWKNAVSELTRIIKNDQSIKTVEMTSWVVAKHPNIMKKFGFTVDEKMDEKEEAEIRKNLPVELRNKPLAKAHISREKFLEMFAP